MHYEYVVAGNDFSNAGDASQDIKKKLLQLGIATKTIKKVSIAMFEAEMNMVIHAHGGNVFVDIKDDAISIVMKDSGPGIPDIEKAMMPGFSTAPQEARNLGWGAGMGLPNIKKNTDFLKVESVLGKGTTVTMEIKIAGS